MAADPQQAASKPTYEELEAQVVAQGLIIAEFREQNVELREQNTELKERIDELERHGGRTLTGVCARIVSRLLALTAALWHNRNTGNSGRHLTSYDH